MAAIAKSSGTAGTAKKAGAKKAGATSTTAAKAKPVNRATVKKAPTKAATPTPTPTPTKSRSARKAEINLNQRRYYIEVAAYYIAERRGFMGGHEEEDWTAAEGEIDQMLADGKLNWR